MARDNVRIGIVGGGRDTRVNLIPGFQAKEGVEVVSVGQTGRGSPAKGWADEHNIPKVYENWVELVQAPDTNAICIGTFPDTHCPITLAALEADKHVLCESRMALNATEARAMLEAAQGKPNLVTQIVPAPSTFQIDNLILERINSGYLGEILSVDMWSGRSIDNRVPGGFLDKEAPLDWRQDWDIHGYNAQGLGIVYETLMRWIGPAVSVKCNAKTYVPMRRGPEGRWRAVLLPDHVDVLCEMACGALAHINVSQATGLAPSYQVWLFGSEATLLVTSTPLIGYLDREIQPGATPSTPREEQTTDAPYDEDVHYRDHHELRVYGACRGDTELTEILNPEESRYQWRVAEEFIASIMGEEKVSRTPFEVGVQYMEFAEAAIRSSQNGEEIRLPF